MSLMPVLPLRDVVVYPHMVIPLFVGRDKSIKALEFALGGSKQILLIAQKESTQEHPALEEIYSMGTIANVLQMLKLPDGTIKVLIEGVSRGKILDVVEREPFFLVQAEAVDTFLPEGYEWGAILRSLLSQFEGYIKYDKKIPSDMVDALKRIEDPIRLVDTIAAHAPLKMSEKQKILEILDLKERMEALMQMLAQETELLQVERKITGDVKKQIEKKQREYYLTEKMHAIQKELGELGEDLGKTSEINNLIEKIKKARMSKEAKDKALQEVNKLKMMSPLSAEATVCRNYIDWLLDVPWNKRSPIRKDFKKVEEILKEEHYGLEKVVERILEDIAVQQRVRKVGARILCFVGPPGVGKTSLGRSIARATGRKFVRMSLGGVRDEAEIRGHRRTYIGALPGKILQKLAKVKVKNPLFLLDEVDKMAMDVRGDPASALLEVLDPEQNRTFNDHYLEVDYDLSDVMFITTANSLNIPSPLLDRMEVIRLSGYTEDEKMQIAKRYLIPKQMKETGLKPSEFDITDAAILQLLRLYTREAGVRNLERELAKLCRKIVKELLLVNVPLEVHIEPADLERYLGVGRYRFGQVETYDQVGQVTGLAWTESGGDILTIEAVSVPGKGKITCTGKLGEVMQESIQAALTVVRSRSAALGIPPDFYEKLDIHIHVPEGATPKDGPSAGIGMCVALVSMLTNTPVRKDVAMTGEITLRGQVLPIGGLKEKLLAAKRGGIRDVVIPDENRRELKEIAEEDYQGLTVHPVRWIDEVFNLALIRMPEPLTLADSPLTKTGPLSKKEDGEERDPQTH